MTQPTTRTIESLLADGSILAIQDGNHGEAHPKASDYVPEGIPFIMASDIRNGTVLLKQAKRLPKARTDQLRIGFAFPGDVLLTHKGTVGEAAIAPDVPHYLMLTPQVTYYRTNSQQLDPRYLVFVFRSPFFQAQLGNVSAQSTRPYVSITTQRRLLLHWHEPIIQRRVASVLGAYDDLIEVNRRRIALLEETARRLFEEWFIRFRFPGHEDHAMVETSEGPLPQGWQVSKIGDVVQLKTGFPFKSSTFSSRGKWRIVTIGNVQDGAFDPNSESCIDVFPEKLPRYCVLKDGDVLISLTGNVGRTCLVHNGPFLLNQRVALVTPLEPRDWPYSYCVFRDPNMRTKLELISNGVAQQNLSPIVAAKLPIKLPPRDLRIEYDRITHPMLDLILKLESAQRRLASSRDLLLPRLISGDLSSVSTAERELETAA
jgi:type I restriction enzyme S subunit